MADWMAGSLNDWVSCQTTEPIWIIFSKGTTLIYVWEVTPRIIFQKSQEVEILHTFLKVSAFATNLWHAFTLTPHGTYGILL